MSVGVGHLGQASGDTADTVTATVRVAVGRMVRWEAGAALCAGTLATFHVLLAWALPDAAPWLTLLPVLVAVVALGAAVLSFLGRRRGPRARTTGAAPEPREAAASTYDQLCPVANTIALLAAARTAEDAARLRGQAVQAVVAAAAQLVRTPRARACWFVLDREAVRPDQVYAGRAEPPRTWFRCGNPAGDAVFQLVESGGHLYCPDTESDPPAGWDASIARNYRTFLAVAVTAERRPLGMLTVDAPTPGDLDAEDLPAVRTLASLLATALCLPAPAARRSTTPTRRVARRRPERRRPVTR